MDFAHSLRLILPEEILSVGGLVLLLAAAAVAVVTFPRLP